jgi:hypothetical protein
METCASGPSASGVGENSASGDCSKSNAKVACTRLPHAARRSSRRSKVRRQARIRACRPIGPRDQIDRSSRRERSGVAGAERRDHGQRRRQLPVLASTARIVSAARGMAAVHRAVSGLIVTTPGAIMPGRQSATRSRARRRGARLSYLCGRAWAATSHPRSDIRRLEGTQ